MLTIVTWLWGNKFSWSDVLKLASGIRRNLKQSHVFICFTEERRILGVVKQGRQEVEVDGVRVDDIRDWRLLSEKGCFARLRIFDPQWQAEIQRCHVSSGIDRLVCVDLDTVITGPLDPLFDRPEPFVIMQHGNASNPCPYNGALMMLRAGAYPEVWNDFSLEAASKIPFYEFPDDQGWLWHKIPNAAGWKCGVESGVFVFHKPGWPGWKSTRDSTPNDALPQGARLVTFSGWRNPKRFSHLDWVKEHWI